MIKKRKIIVIFLLFFALFLVVIYHFMSVLSTTENEITFSEHDYESKILGQLYNLPKFYHVRSNYHDNISEIFIRSLTKRTRVVDVVKVWADANQAVVGKSLFSVNGLGDVVGALQTARVIKADLDTRGTQLKLLLTLEGDQTVVFKPKWYEKEKIIEGPVYAGKDRYGSEIIAFYLAGILNKPLVPISVERTLNVQKEITPVASKALTKTSFRYKNSTCIYGKCFYCKKEDPICDINGYLTGAVIFNVGATLKVHRSPWQRTYKKTKKAEWEIRSDYCKSIAGKFSKQRLYDLVDTAIFDFLIQNGDRHHYETLGERIVWIDNGKGLGNYQLHHIDILAPLYQCCLLRSDTWSRLQNLSGGVIAESLRKIENITNVVTEEHLKAIDDRLLIVFATVEYCRNRNKINHNLFYMLLIYSNLISETLM